MASLLVVGGSSGIGRVIAERAVARGDQVTVTGLDPGKAQAVARELGGATRGLGLDLSQPTTIAGALAEVGELDHVVISAIAQATNSVRSFDVTAAVQAITTKLVGYTEVLRVLQPRLRPGAAVVLFGGLAKDRPYPGSTMVTAFNGGVAALVKTLAIELAPVRVNAVHPGLVGDSPKWKNIVGPGHPAVQRTPIGRLVTMAECADATEFLLRNGGMNAHNLAIEGGTLAQ